MTTSLGGPPVGNQNARQHGLYSQKSPLPPAEQIEALRAYIASLLARMPTLQTPRQVGLALRRVTLASNALNRLIRAQLFPPVSPPDSAPGFGYPNLHTPRSSFSNQQSTISNPWTARFPFIHSVTFNLVHLLIAAGLSGHSP